MSSILRVSSEKSLRFSSIHALAKERFRTLLEPGPGAANFTAPEDPEGALSLAVEYDISSVRLYTLLHTSAHILTTDIGPESSLLQRRNDIALRTWGDTPIVAAIRHLAMCDTSGAADCSLHSDPIHSCDSGAHDVHGCVRGDVDARCDCACAGE